MEKLTHKEEEIMDVLWELGKAFVKEIVAAIPEENHYNTISSIVRGLEAKGYVSYDAYGKTHHYYPLIKKEDYADKFLHLASKRFFDNSYKDMVSFFVKEQKISAEELREIIEIIEKKK